MNWQIENLRKTRKYVIDFVKDLSLEKINKIPHGFNNNILWNMGHLVAAQQSICYTKGGLSSTVSESGYALYKPGTKPERFYDNNEEDAVKALLISSVQNLQRDYDSGYFHGFVPWTNRYGNSLNNVDEAIAYLHFHEGLHLGVISSLRKLVTK
jgi:hypothetical protein